MNQLVTSPIKIVIGFITTTLLLILFTGPGNTMGIYAFSIICTAGISLALWIPLWLGVGAVVFSIANTFSILPAVKKVTIKEDIITLTNDQKALINYIKIAREKNISDDNIFSLLINNGWSENAIRDAFGLVEKHKSQYPELP